MSKEGFREGIWIINPTNDVKMLIFKLYFRRANNVVEYEALILGLKTLKDLKTKKYLFMETQNLS